MNSKKKATAKKNDPLAFTKQELDRMAKKAEAEMKRLGFKNIDDYTAYIDKKRGY